MEEAENKAAKAIADAKEEAEVIISELKDLQKQGVSVKEHKLIDARKQLEEATPQLLNKKQRQVKRVAQKAKPELAEDVQAIAVVAQRVVHADETARRTGRVTVEVRAER